MSKEVDIEIDGQPDITEEDKKAVETDNNELDNDDIEREDYEPTREEPEREPAIEKCSKCGEEYEDDKSHECPEQDDYHEDFCGGEPGDDDDIDEQKPEDEEEHEDMDDSDKIDE